LPLAAAVAPVGVLGVAGAAAWAVHRRRVQEREDAIEDEDDEL
jgi:cytochrome c-type biogenesis protein CcmH/NrfF